MPDDDVSTMERFEAEWLAARGPYDEAALDPVAVDLIRHWGAELGGGSSPVVVDLGSGTGAALDRVGRWLAPRDVVAYAVDQDPSLLFSTLANGRLGHAVPIVGDLLEPLDARGGPPDGTVDLVVAHALADLVPLDQLASRAFALARPGGLVHVALAYDGLTAFSPAPDPDLEASILAAFHRHMDRPAAQNPAYGGSTAGRRLAPALAAAGLEVVTDAPSCWLVCAGDRPNGRRVLSRLLQYVVDGAREIGRVSADDLARWERRRRDAIEAGTLTVRVGHRDVLARRP
jgi:SAM-dependent methyltransferase